MANIQLVTTPTYKTLTATASLATSTYDLTLMDDHDGLSAMNNIPNVYDIDLSLGNIVINLFAISSLMAGKTIGLGFTVKGTITATAGGNNVVFRAFNNETEVNTICGVATATVAGAAGTAFILTPAGSTNWILLTCTTTS